MGTDIVHTPKAVSANDPDFIIFHDAIPKRVVSIRVGQILTETKNTEIALVKKWSATDSIKVC